MTRVLITGGAGFVGSHLCQSFLEGGDEVICVDNLITGNYENVARFSSHKRFTFVNQHVSRFIKFDGALDYVLHFASPASPVDYLDRPIPTLKVGSLGTHNTMGLAKEKNALFLLASTSEVYGDPLVDPQHEEYWAM